MLVDDDNWRLAAACRFAEPDLFFPVSSSGKALKQVAEAKAICAQCQVVRSCLAFALRTRQVHGVWGGTTEEERYLMWRKGAGRPDPASGNSYANRGQGDYQSSPNSLAG